MKTITLLQPRKLVFGRGCLSECARDLIQAGYRRLFLVTSPPTASLAEPLTAELRASGISVTVYDKIAAEPSVAAFEQTLAAARKEKPDAVVGLGGGSAVDVAKLLAALLESRQTAREVFGIDRLEGRRTPLVCLPTTSGTGTEVSRNAILLDEEDQLKKGVVSPHLVPDAAYVDPLLTLTMPPPVTAATGLDALTHCIEAYANRNAHPMIDLYALEGTRLIGANLLRAVEDGDDVEAREAMSLGSLYGGLCLGPVNTAAVHALAYPLGGEFHVAHGVSNALLLPHVLEFNLEAAPDRYAQVAVALGVERRQDPVETAREGLERIRELSRKCGIPQTLRELGIPQEAIPRMARAGMTVTRLLKNNPRELTTADAEAIYRSAYA